MIRQRSGKSLSISAAYAWYGGPVWHARQRPRWALIALSQSLAVEWGQHNVQVNCLCPGFVDTEQSRALLWPTKEGRERIVSTHPRKVSGRPSHLG